MPDNREKRMVLTVICVCIGVTSILLLTRWVLASNTTPQALGVELGPDYTGEAYPGQTILYSHILTNTGTATDTYLVETLSTQGWSVELLGGDFPSGTTLLPLQVAAQMTASFSLSLTAPLDAAGITDITHVTATSQLSPTVQDTAVDTTNVVYYRVYLPLNMRYEPPVTDYEGRAPGWGFDAGHRIKSISISSHAETIAVGTSLTGISVLDDAGNLIWSDLSGPDLGQIEVSVSSDGNFIVAAAEEDEGRIYAYNRQGESLWSYETGHPQGDPFWSKQWWLLDMSEDTNTIAGSARDGYVVAFNRNGDLLWEWQTDASVLSLAVSGDGSTIVVGANNNVIYCFDRERRLLWEYAAAFRVNSIDVSRNGDLVVAYSKNILAFNRQGVLQWEAPDWEWVMSSGDTFFKHVAVSKDGERIYAAFHRCDCGNGCCAHLYAFDGSGNKLWSTDGYHRVWPYWLRTADDGRVVALGSGSEDLPGGRHIAHVHVFDSAGHLLWYFEKEDFAFLRIDISSDGSALVGGFDDLVLAWGLSPFSAVSRGTHKQNPSPSTEQFTNQFSGITQRYALKSGNGAGSTVELRPCVHGLTSISTSIVDYLYPWRLTHYHQKSCATSVKCSQYDCYP